MNQSITTRLSNIVGLVIATIIILLPFHEFLTTWTGSNFNHLEVWRIWKEILILLLTPLVIFIALKTPKLRQWAKKDWLFRLIIIYIVLNIGIGLWAHKLGHVNTAALGDGLIIDLRFLVFFIFAAVAAYKSTFLKEKWQSILLLPSALVVAFGIAQLFLPLAFLKHFGYGSKTIPAYETVDSKLQYHRIQSTLRGANPFGAYLILIINAAFVNLKKNKWLELALITASLIALFFTYSRSAYIGASLSLIALYYLIKLDHKWRKQFLIGLTLAAVALSIFVLIFRYNSVADNVLFHTDKSSKSKISSNAVRLSSLRYGLSDVYHHPFGEGPGSAGPASTHNNHPAKIAENYYIQVAQETGWLGLAVFIAINVIVVLRLWRVQRDPLASVLLASFIGISVVNLVSHEWADDTLSIIWWGMTGIMLTPAILKNNK